METPPKRLPRVRLVFDKLGWTILAFVIAGVLIGIQSIQYQHAQDRAQLDNERADWRLERANIASDSRTKCTEKWGRDLVDTVRTRAAAGNARNDALDNIILTIVAARRIPPEADEQDFDRSLRVYVRAIQENRTARNQYPYSKLKCDDEVAAALAAYDATHTEPGKEE